MRNGADILVQSLINNGIDTMFAYPGGTVIPIHQALTRYRDKIRVILPRHEQGGGFAAQGYARSTGKIGVCMATSGPGATNLITAIADAKLDSIPMLILTGQVNMHMIGNDAFQEVPMTEICRSITKHHYLVTDVNDITRVVKEAIFVATTGRPGPVLIDIPRSVQVTQCENPQFDPQMHLPGYSGISPKASDEELAAVVDAIAKAHKPVILAGGGIITAGASKSLLTIAEKTGIPVTTTMTALSAFPRSHKLSLGMLGMHGTAYSNLAVHDSDLFLVFGARFSDRVTGNVAAFAKHATIVHIDIDPSEIGKIKTPNITILSDIGYALEKLAKKVKKPTADLSPWIQKIDTWKKELPLKFPENSPYIMPQQAIQMLRELTRDKDPIICTGVGQHQMWTAQFFGFEKPRSWISSSGLGTMGFGLPSAMGAKIANPDRLVVNIDGDGSFQMNIQEMGTCHCENIPVKVMLLNNQHLGMVMQWEDRFHDSNRGHTYLGPIDHPEWYGKGVGAGPEQRYPDFVEIAKGYQWDALSISKPEELGPALQAMIKSKKPFLHKKS